MPALSGSPESPGKKLLEGDDTPEEVVVAYHERTKHHYHRYAASLGQMDWAIAYGDIREEKKLIDLYVWIDRHGTNEAVFRFTTDAGLNVAQRFFGCPESLAGV